MDNLFNMINKIFIKFYNSLIEIISDLSQLKNYTKDEVKVQDESAYEIQRQSRNCLTNSIH